MMENILYLFLKEFSIFNDIVMFLNTMENIKSIYYIVFNYQRKSPIQNKACKEDMKTNNQTR